MLCCVAKDNQLKSGRGNSGSRPSCTTALSDLFIEAKMNKKCTVCGKIKELSEFNTRPDRPSGYRSECKRCQYDRQYRRLKNNPHIYRAKHAARIACKKGLIQMPLLCERCGKKGVLEKHHPDYDKPLEVVWVHKRCHSKLHSSRKIA